MTKVLALDPGLSTGFAISIVTPHAPVLFLKQGVIENGCEGFIDWWTAFYSARINDVDLIVCERFVIDGTHTGVWSPQIEGALMALAGVPIAWQLRSDKALLFGQTFKGDRGQTERFEWLRERGFTGVSHELDAITHTLFWLKRQGHKPTLRKYWP